MPTKTSNYDFNKPIVDSAEDEDLWGGQLNDNWDSIDALLNRPVSSKSASYTVLSSDARKVILGDASSAAFTVSLLDGAAAGSGFDVSIIKTDSSSNGVTINPNGSEEINGESSIVLSSQFEFVTIKWSGSEWIIISNGLKSTQSQAEAGANNLSLMTPLSTSQAINALAFNAENFLHVQDQKASETNAGASSVGNQTREINTTLRNTITGASLASNQITLPAGDYYIEASAPSYRSGRHKIKLKNVTDSTNEVIGTSSFNDRDEDAQNASFISGYFSIAAEKDFEIQHYISLAKTIDGLGIATNEPGVVEVYTDVKIWKIG